MSNHLNSAYNLQLKLKTFLLHSNAYSPPLSCVSAPSTPLFQSCSCLPTTALYVSVDASLSAKAKATLTAAAVALLAADQSFCVDANAVAAAAAVASTAANYTANILLVGSIH